MARINRFVCVVGLPRSGTTLLGAMLDAHPAVDVYFEPCGPEGGYVYDEVNSLEEFLTAMKLKFQMPFKDGATIAAMKHPIIDPGPAAWCERTLTAISGDCPVTMLVLVRDPIECFLSRIEGGHKYWGYPKLEPTHDRLKQFLARATKSMRCMTKLFTTFDGVSVFYGALAREPGRVMARVCESIGISFDPSTLDYYLRGPQPRKVRGDPVVAHAPEPVRADLSFKRRNEAEQYRTQAAAVIDGYPELFDLVSRLASQSTHIA